MKKPSQSGSEVGDSSGSSGRSQVARTHHVSRIPTRKKPSPAPAPVPAPAPAPAPRNPCSENFDSIADDVVGEIIKKACQTVEERREEVDETDQDDDIWPTNEEYNIERGKDAISRCLSNR